MENLTPNDFNIIAQKDRVIPIDPTLDSLSDLGAKVGGEPVSEVSYVNGNIVVYESSESVAAVSEGAGLVVPAVFNKKIITTVRASVFTKGVTGTTTVVLKKNRGGVVTTVTSTGITIGDEWTAEDGVLDTGEVEVLTGDLLYATVTTVHTTAPKGLSIVITFK